MSQVTEQSVRFQTALASIKLIQASAVLDLTEDDFDFLTSNKVWIATDRSRARRCVEARVYGTMDFVGYPRFPAPVEFIAAAIAYYVHPANFQTARLLVEGAEFSANIINGAVGPVKGAGLFGFTLRVRAGERATGAKGADPSCEARHADEEQEDRESNHGRPAVSDPGPHFLHSAEGDPEGGLEWRDNSGSDYHFGRSHVFPSRNLDPGVEQKQDEVGDEVRKHDRNAPDDDDELEERKVEVVDGLDCLPTNSVVVEDDLHLVGSTDHEGDVERDQGDHWRQTARDNVTAEDLAVAEPFRLRGRDEVLRHDVDEGAPHDERNSGERAERKGQGRQDEVLSGARQVGSVPRPRSQHVVVVSLGRQSGPPCEVVTDDGAFLEHREEEEPEPEDRHPIQEDSRGSRQDVERLAPLLSRDRADEHADDDRGHRRGTHEDQGPTQVSHQHVEDGKAESVGNSPVQGDRPLEIDEKLFPRGLAEPEELAIVLGEALIFRVARGQAQRRISGHQSEERVVQTNNPEDRDRGVNDLPDHDLQDSRQFASLPSLPGRSIFPITAAGARAAALAGGRRPSDLPSHPVSAPSGDGGTPPPTP